MTSHGVYGCLCVCVPGHGRESKGLLGLLLEWEAPGRVTFFWVSVFCAMRARTRLTRDYSHFVRGLFSTGPVPSGTRRPAGALQRGAMISTASIGLYDKFTGTVAAGEMKDMKRKNVHGAGKDP